MIRIAEGSDERGYHAGKNIAGRKWQLAVDTFGLVLAVVVHSPAILDQRGAEWVMCAVLATQGRLRRFCVQSIGIAKIDKGSFRLATPDRFWPADVKGGVVWPKR